MTRVADVTVFADDLGFIEGPVWDAGRQTLSVVSINRGMVYSLDHEGRRISSATTGGGPNGMVLGERGLIVAQNGGIFGASGPATPGVQLVVGESAEFLATDLFVAPNDLAFGPDGRLYVTDPQTDRAVLEPIPGNVLACDVATGACEIVVADRLCPNGLAFTPDGEQMLLAQTQARRVERFAVLGRRLETRGLFCEIRNGRPDGMAIDASSQVWICTPGTGGIERYDANGVFIERIEIGEKSMTTNLCFGGRDLRSLFVTAAGWGQVLRLETADAGIPLARGW